MQNKYPVSAEAIFRIAHDLGSPFRHVTEFIRIVLARHPELPDDTTQMLNLVVERGNRAGAMLEGLLTIEAAEATVPNLRRVSAAELSEELSEQLQCEVLGAVEGSELETDPALLARAVAELVENAEIHGQYGGVTIARVDAETRIQVLDNGEGIPADSWEDALLPFRCLSPVKDENRLGLGLPRAAVFARLAGSQLRNLPEGVCVSIPA